MAARPWFLPDEDTPNLGNGRFRVFMGATIRSNGFSVKYDLTFNVSPQNIKFNDPTILLRNFWSLQMLWRHVPIRLAIGWLWWLKSSLMWRLQVMLGHQTWCAKHHSLPELPCASYVQHPTPLSSSQASLNQRYEIGTLTVSGLIVFIIIIICLCHHYLVSTSEVQPPTPSSPFLPSSAPWA